ncbi:MAG: DNA-directed RNA polymerase subunit D [Halobacteriales archaeon]
MAADYDIEMLDRGDREAEFLVRGISPAFANGIRRAMLADVPTMSIEDVRVIENSSVMFDEVIGLRLGLIPLTTPLDALRGDDTVTLRLDAEGPGTAYSGDLETSDGTVRPADENIPIIELKEGQRLAFEADAVLGRGREHAKHQGGVSVGYRHLQAVEVEGEAGEYADREPHIVRGYIEEDGEVIDADTFGNDLTERYPDSEVSVRDVPGAFVFHVETDGSFSVDDLVERAVRSVFDRADALEEAVQL